MVFKIFILLYFVSVNAASEAYHIKYRDNCNYLGYNVPLPEKHYKFVHLNIKQCSIQCKDMPQCTHFTWSKREGCFLKSASSEQEVEASYQKVIAKKCGILFAHFAGKNNTVNS